MIEQILCYKTPFFNIVTTTSYALSLVTEKSLHVILQAWLSGTWLVFTQLSPLLKCTTHRLTVLTSTAWSSSTFSKQQ